MRIFIYSLQSSGASLFCYWLAQQEGYLCVVDLGVRFYAPKRKRINSNNFILKAAVSKLDLHKHIDRFQPEKKILFVRDPYQNYASLQSKIYKNIKGNIDEKFKKADDVFKNSSCFDAVIKYEDFICNKELVIKELNNKGIPASFHNYDFFRSLEEIIDFNCQQSKVLAKTFDRQWRIGNIHRRDVKTDLNLKTGSIDENIKKKVEELCPNLAAFYSNIS